MMRLIKKNINCNISYNNNNNNNNNSGHNNNNSNSDGNSDLDPHFLNYYFFKSFCIIRIFFNFIL
jgi:hypothetical protein